jgi:hypothetical protein
MIHAALFDDAGSPVKIITGTAKQLNANTKGGKTWREIPTTIKITQDVPPLAELEPHILLVERED